MSAERHRAADIDWSGRLPIKSLDHLSRLLDETMERAQDNQKRGPTAEEPNKVKENPSPKEKAEVKALLTDPDRLSGLYQRYGDTIDVDKNGYLDSAELSAAAANDKLSHDAQLLAQSLSRGYNDIKDISNLHDRSKLRQLLSGSSPTGPGISSDDIVAFSEASKYQTSQAPHWLSLRSPSWAGEFERLALRGVIVAGALCGKGTVSPLINVFLGSWVIGKLDREADRYGDLEIRHKKISEMLKRLE